MTSNEDRAIEQFRFRLAGLFCLKHTLTALTIWAFVAGIAVLILRYLGLSSLSLLWGLLTIPLAVAPALILATRSLPSPGAVRAVLDRHSQCGGLLMSGDEVKLGAWRQVMPLVHLPRLQWRSQRAWGLLAAGVAFVVLGLLLPEGLAEMGNPGLNIDNQKAKLDKQINVLKEEALLEPRKAEDIKAKLDQIRRDALGKEPSHTLVDLDHIKDMLSKTAREGAEATARKKETLGKAETLADLLKKKKAGDLSAKATAEAMQQLATLTRKAAEENEMVQNKLELDKELEEALKAGTLTPEQLEKLKDLLKDGQGNLSHQLDKLCKADLIDGDLLDKCKEAGECDCEGLAEFLKKNGSCKELCDMVALCEKPGRGGLTRGPGAAEMLWKDPTTEDGFKFKEEALPPAKLKALKDSRKIGLSAGAPGKSQGAETTGSGALTGAEGDGGSASTQVVLPRHRGAVERYFERPSKSGN